VSEFFLKNNLCYTFKQAQKQEPYTEGYNGDTVFFKKYWIFLFKIFILFSFIYLFNILMLKNILF
jgi:hypothetical protein